MKKKIIIRSVLVIVLGIIIYNSFYFCNLEEMKNEARRKNFNHEEYAEDFWNNKLLKNLDSSSDIIMVLELLKTDMTKALEFSHTLGVSNFHSFLLNGNGQIIEINEDNFVVELADGKRVEILTDYIFGNSVRDASGLMDVNDFPNTMAFNNISEKLNDYVVKDVIEPFKDKIVVETKIQFVGTTEISEDNPGIDPLKIVPVRLSVK